MIRWSTACCVALAATALSSEVRAQMQPLEEGLAVGRWNFYPSLELRLRGEYRRDPVDVGGVAFQKDAVQAEAFESVLPERAPSHEPINNQYILSERSRLGLGVEYDVIGAQLTLQDARVLATSAGFGVFEPFEGYLEVRTQVDDPWLWVRAGRQVVRWGDGRLIGDSDWAPRARALDALRMRFDFGDIEAEALAALLVSPLPIPPPHTASGDARYDTSDEGTGAEGTGAQLYGVNASWRIIPLFGVELAGLARVARDPLPRDLTRSDTYTIDLRVFGEERGVSYAAEGAYQLGRVAGYGFNRNINAFAAAARVSWQTALPLNFRFGARGSYASGDDSGGTGEELTRFDPILPTQHEHHGMMDLYAWSNIIDAGGDVSIRPVDMLTIGTAYSFVALAEKKDRWSSAYLTPIGASDEGGSRILGHEIDAWLRVAPWEELSFSGGYGMFVLGERAELILREAGRFHDGLLHYAFVQTELIVP